MKPTRSAFIRPDGLAYRTHTSAALYGGPVFVLLHGIGMSHRYLAKLHRALADVGTVISFDLPGFGGTPKPRQRVTVEQYAALIAHALRRVDVTQCVVIGHSMGSQFAVELARQSPELVTHTVPIGPVVDSRRRSVFRQAAALGLDVLVETPHTNAIVFTDYIRCGMPWYLTELREMMAYPTEERVSDVPGPVLVIRGAKDPVAGRVWSAVLAARAGKGRVVEIPGCGHVVQQSAPATVAQTIHDFTLSAVAVGATP